MTIQLLSLNEFVQSICSSRSVSFHVFDIDIDIVSNGFLFL